VHRRALTIASAISLLLCMGSAVLSLRNWSTDEFVVVGHKVWKGAFLYESRVAAAQVGNGRISFTYTGSRLDFSPPQQVVFRQPMDVKTFRLNNPSGTSFLHRRYPPGGARGPAHDWHGFRWYAISGGSLAERVVMLELTVPAWFFMLVTALPALWLVIARRRLRRSRRIAAGLCIKCAYDLRASTDRCPECGARIPSTAVSVQRDQISNSPAA
jgi:hypothetical protein